MFSDRSDRKHIRRNVLQGLPDLRFRRLDCDDVPTLGSSHAKTRVHRAHRRSGRIAARGGSAAKVDAGDRVPSPGPPEAGGPLLGGFRLGLSEAGYTEGQTVAIEYHWVEANERLAATAGDLVGRKVDLIVAITDPVARSTQTASSTTPIVFFIGGDPVANGLVASLARPGANLTGVTVFGDELNPKRLELACELVPDAKVIALLINPNNPSRAVSAKSADMQQAARSKAVQLRIVNATSESEIDAAFASLAELQARALIIDTDLFLFGQRAQIGALAARHSVPAIYYRREFVAAGA